jgi:Skp family chaperone for outer membrane proteins
MSNDLMNVDLSLDKNDIIAIKVSEVEVDLQNKLADASKQIKEGNQKVDGLRKKIQASVDKRLKKGVEEKVKTVTDAFDYLGITVDSSVNVVIDDHNGGVIKIQFDQRANDYHYARFSKETNFKYNKSEKKLCEEIKKVQEFLSELQDYVIALRQQLSKINTLERQVRASLARKALESKGHSDILKRIDGIKGFPALPEPPAKRV